MKKSSNLKKNKSKKEKALSFNPKDTENKKSSQKETDNEKSKPKETENKKSNPKETDNKKNKSKEAENKKSNLKENENKKSKPKETESKKSDQKEIERKKSKPKDTESKKSKQKDTESKKSKPKDTESKKSTQKENERQKSKPKDTESKKNDRKETDKKSKSKPKDSESKKSERKETDKQSKSKEKENKKSNPKKKDDRKETQIYNNKEIMFINNEEKEGYCVNKYDNGDAYFGYYANDLRNQNGFYFYHPTYINKKRLSRYYMGFWKDDLRQGFGIYLWARDRKKERFYENFEKSNFKVYVGNFDSDNFVKGTYLSKENEDYFVYHGTFSKNQKREGKNCFYYNSNSEILMYGTFKDNEFIDGFFANFDDDGNIKQILKYKNKKIESFEKNAQNDKATEIMKAFRNCIMAEDYFGIIFKVFSSVVKTKEDYLFDIDIVNTYKHEEFMDMCKAYKKIKIFHDIENFVIKNYNLN